MDFSVGSLFAGFFFGVWGMFLIRQGKANAHPWHALTGLSLIVFPYFVQGIWLTWGIGLALIGIAYVKR